MNKAITIQLNSLEALERLIGGDAQLEIDIRNSVVQSFAEKHLKAIASSEAVAAKCKQVSTAVDTAFRAEVEQRIGNITKNFDGTVRAITLRTEVRSELSEAINERVKTAVRDATRESLDKFVEQIPALVDAAVKHRVTYELDEIVKNRVREAIANALKGVK